MIIDIPHYKTLDIKHLVLDYNGTIAKDGKLNTQIAPCLYGLSAHCKIHVITADTFGTVQAQLEGFDVQIKILSSQNHTAEKAYFIEELGAENCVAIGNGNNDKEMLQLAQLGIALLGDEGVSTQTLLCSDVLCRDIVEALELLLYPKRLVATLRC